jgi:hypothetical protein
MIPLTSLLYYRKGDRLTAQDVTREAFTGRGPMILGGCLP